MNFTYTLKFRQSIYRLFLLFVLISQVIFGLSAQQFIKVDNRVFKETQIKKHSEKKQGSKFLAELGKPLPYKRFSADIPLLLGMIFDFTITPHKSGGMDMSYMAEFRQALTRKITVGLQPTLGVRMGNYLSGVGTISLAGASGQKEKITALNNTGNLILRVLFTGDYYLRERDILKKNKFLAFVGGGFGFIRMLYSFPESDQIPDGVIKFTNGKEFFLSGKEKYPKWYMVFAPRVGIEWRRLRLLATYNLNLNCKNFVAHGFTNNFNNPQNKREAAVLKLPMRLHSTFGIYALIRLGGDINPDYFNK